MTGENKYRVEYGSVLEALKVAKKHALAGTIAHHKKGGRIPDEDFVGAVHFDQVEHLAVNGWDEQSDVALQAASEAIDTVEKMVDMPSFKGTWGVSGCEVDVARYLEGEPENMIDYEMIQAPRNGRVITLCASGSVSWAVSRDTINRRGYIITALALALSRIGFATELWLDLSASGAGEAHMRVLVKGPNDELDPARVMYAYAHPSMFRSIGFGIMHDLPEEWQEKIGVGSYYGYPLNPAHDLPEGTLYLPCLKTSGDVPDADQALLGYMRELGIVDGE